MSKEFQEKNAVLTSLMNHRSIRKFKDQPIAPEVVETLLLAGVRAASGGNLQNYSFIVVDDPEVRNKLADLDRFNNLANVPLIIIAIVDLYRLKRWFALSNTAPVTLTGPLPLLMSNWDALIALHNLTIAAESMGLGAYYDGNILELDVKDLFHLPDGTFPAGMVCIGYPDQNTRLSERLPLQAVVHHNQYHIPTDDEIKEHYRNREAVWERVLPERKAELAKEGISSIPQAIARQKFNAEFVNWRNERVYRNLAQSGFELELTWQRG